METATATVTLDEIAAELTASPELVVAVLDRLGIAPVEDWRGGVAITASDAARVVATHRTDYEKQRELERHYDAYIEEREADRQRVMAEARGSGIPSTPWAASRRAERVRAAVEKFEKKNPPMSFTEFAAKR